MAQTYMHMPYFCMLVALEWNDYGLIFQISGA